MNDYLNVRDSFVKLDVAVEKGKLVDNISLGEEPFDDILVIGKDKQTLQFYRFNNNITIVRERHEESGKTHRMIQTGINPLYSDDPYCRDWSRYYVLNENGLVTDEKEVKKTIQETTGVNLPVLDGKIRLGQHSREKYRTILDRVVIETTVDEKDAKMYPSGCQPNDRIMLRETKKIERLLGSLQKEFGFKNPEEFGKKFKVLTEVSKKISKELAKEN